jgi:prophage antirepressor-like protein
MLNLSPLQYDNRAIRVQTDEFGEPWFNANDVCGALDLANPRDALTKHCDPDDVAKRDIIDSLGRTQLASFVNDSGIHALVFGSTKPEAKKFKRWVTKEVLPSIRKTGQYAVPGAGQVPPAPALSESTQVLADSLMAASLLHVPLHLAQTEAVKDALRLTGRDFSNLLLLAPAQSDIKPEDESLEPTELGAAAGISAIKMNQALAAAGLQVKTVDGWSLTERGATLATRHHWKKGDKTGYNFKWNRSVLQMIAA